MSIKEVLVVTRFKINSLVIVLVLKIIKYANLDKLQRQSIRFAAY